MTAAFGKKGGPAVDYAFNILKTVARGGTRWSIVYEYTPVQFLQLRAGARIRDGIPQSDAQNAQTYFIECHAFF